MTKTQIKDARKILFVVANRIKKYPENYNQKFWCGTACCIAGHIVQANKSAKPIYGNSFRYRKLSYSVDFLAKKFLHLDTDELNDFFNDVFHTSAELHWPKKYALQLQRAKSNERKAEITHNFIKDYIIPKYFPLKSSRKKK